MAPQEDAIRFDDELKLRQICKKKTSLKLMEEGVVFQNALTSMKRSF